MSEPSISRRDFAAVAVGAAASACIPTIPAAAAPLQAQQPAPAPDAQFLYDMIRGRYTKHLDNDQWQRVRTQIANQLNAAQRLRTFAVGQDDPDFIFTADVG
jgi:hypothetical protein